MTKREIIAEIGSIIDEVKAALFATVGTDNRPSVRWVTPAILRGRERAIFCITAPGSSKVEHLEKNPNVQWVFQTRSLDRIITVDGRVNVINNPSIRSEVLEEVGSKLHAFWKVTTDERDLLVLETIIERATFYLPMKGTKERVDY